MMNRRHFLALSGLAVVAAQVAARPASAIDIVKPRRGSRLRREILDAARPTFEYETSGPVEFVVGTLNVWGEWAFISVRPQRPGGAPIDWSRTRHADYADYAYETEASFALLWHDGTGWVLREHMIAPTDASFMVWPEDYGLPRSLFTE